MPGAVLTRLVRDGDAGATKALCVVAEALGEVLGVLQSILDPDLFVIGGGVADIGEPLLAMIRSQYAATLPGGSHRPHAEIRIARLGNHAGFIGAADLARR